MAMRCKILGPSYPSLVVFEPVPIDIQDHLDERQARRAETLERVWVPQEINGHAPYIPFDEGDEP